MLYAWEGLMIFFGTYWQPTISFFKKWTRKWFEKTSEYKRAVHVTNYKTSNEIRSKQIQVYESKENLCPA